MNIDLERIEALLRAMSEHDVRELEIEQGDQRLVLRRGVGAPVPAPLAVAAPAVAPATVLPAAVPVSTTAPATIPPPAPASPASETPGEQYVTSPFVGTFYRAPRPDAPPFVQPGDEVRAGTTLCIVEAMKLMNEIEAEFDCTILEVLVENGKPVEFGQRLFRVRRR
ncbi:MAG: acetyl-CoA carboxylase biotin carboxyl carrier protein [Myxococcota bacterium]|nr:acetyl-CoA carboxylase biotin carboxyl carrier protein [Myxococcota bacterium]MDW8360798.1 acetyl-CoA carboxylase biotin carboxyl carrier protein [Myxococcales bacterium]